MALHKTASLNAPAAQVYRILKANLQQSLPQMADFIRWDDAKRTGVIDYMNAKATIAVSDATPSVCTIDLSLAPPASLMFPEAQAEQKIEELLSQLKKSFP